LGGEGAARGAPWGGGGCKGAMGALPCCYVVSVFVLLLREEEREQGEEGEGEKEEREKKEKEGKEKKKRKKNMKKFPNLKISKK
jgi:hypothetical protein